MQIDKNNLPRNPAELREMLLKTLQENELLKWHLRAAELEAEAARQRQFGRKADVVDPKMVSLFNEAEAEADANKTVPSDLAEEEEEKEVEIGKHKRKARGKRKPIPEHIARVEHVHDIPAEEKICKSPGCGCELKRIGEEISENLDYVPAKIIAHRHVRPKYSCPKCQDGVKIASKPAQPLPKSMAEPGLLAHIAVSKYADSLPLHRLESIFKRIGLDLSRTTMARWMIGISEILDPVVKGLCARALDGPIVQSDETTIQVLKQPGKAVGSDCYMWVLARNEKTAPVVVFNFDPSRSKAVPLGLFAKYQGYLQADGYSGYDAVGKRDGITRIGCWAHARRKFTDALKIAGDKAEGTIAFAAVNWIKSLYKIEHEAAEMDAPARHQLRQEKSVPILKDIRTWLDKVLPEVLTSSPTGKGLTYMNNEWEYLANYVADGSIEIDNNFAERAIRPFAIGRRNWMFADTPAGAHASAKLYSIIESAKANGLDPYEYLKFLLTELPKSANSTVDRFMPWNFSRRHLN